MYRKLAFLLLPLALLAAACTSGGDGSGAASDTNAPDSPAVVVDDSTSDDAEPDTSVSVDDVDDGDRVGNLLGSINPFDLLSGGLGGGAAVSGDVDPALADVLLDQGDLPSDFIPFGEFSFSIPTEVGSVDMVANMFTSGDLSGTEVGSMVMSAVIVLPPEAISEFGDLEDFVGLNEADLAELEAQMGEFGDFADIEILDASDLGDGGFGMHIAMDFSELFGAFGAPASGTDEISSITMDMFGFLKGDNMLMVMVMTPDGSGDVDARDLAEQLEDNASAL